MDLDLVAVGLVASISPVVVAAIPAVEQVLNLLPLGEAVLLYILLERILL
ncbi:MAG: hypothetical protein H6560_04155 [Lewinellaceae bacterium]|nr:hypothetical protein [Lewinellaceae bacterium]